MTRVGSRKKSCARKRPDDIDPPRRVCLGPAEGVVWYLSQDYHGEDAATKLAMRFSGAVDLAIAGIAERPDAGAIWPHRRDYRFRVLRKPFQRWLIFYRQPAEDVVELVELIAEERDLPRRLPKT